MTELEFKSLALQGFNRIPLIAEAFADLETPLSLYLKLARADGGGAASFLLESVVGGERFGRYSLHRPAGAHAAARERLSAPRSSPTAGWSRPHEGNPLDFIAAYQKRFKVALRPGLPRFCGGLAGYFGYDAVRYIEPRLAATVEAGRHRHARHPAAAMRGARGHRQPLGPALPHRLRRSGRSPRPASRARRRLRRADRQAALLSVTAPPVRARRRRTRCEREFAKADYLAAVLRAKEYIAAGDMMQVQVGQRLQQALHRVAAQPVPRAALAEPVALHVLLRHGRLPGRRRLARDPGAPGAHAPKATRSRSGRSPARGRAAPRPSRTRRSRPS